MEEMKMKKMLVLVSVLLLSSAAMAETWDLDLDFETALTNPNGAWSYGYVQNGVFTAYDGLVHDADISGSMRTAWRVGTDWDTYGNMQKILEGEASFDAWTSYRYGGELCSGPGGDPAVKTIARWTCPADGSYGISAVWQGLSTKPEGTTVDVTLEKNGEILYSGALAGFIGHDNLNYSDRHGVWEQSFSDTLNLLQNDYLDLTIACGADGQGADCTNMDLTIVPEPITMALLGLGGMALLRRRR